MSQLPSSRPVSNTDASRIISIIFACLACIVFLFGSIQICLIWFDLSTIYHSGGVVMGAGANYEGDSIATVLFLLVTLFIFWLLGTVALIFARRWIAVALILPVIVILFMGIFLSMGFLISSVPGGPKVAFVLLFVLLNVLLFGVAWRLLIRPSYRLTHGVA